MLEESLAFVQQESKSSSHDCIQWELGTCWVQQLQTQAAAQKDTAEAKAKEGVNGPSAGSEKTSKAPHWCLISIRNRIFPRKKVGTYTYPSLLSLPVSSVSFWLWFPYWICQSSTLCTSNILSHCLQIVISTKRPKMKEIRLQKTSVRTMRRNRRIQEHRRIWWHNFSRWFCLPRRNCYRSALQHANSRVTQHLTACVPQGWSVL
jgi:hypothetical protein